MAGTTFYQITRDDLARNDSFIKDNVWALELLYSRSLEDAIKVDELFGSKVINEILFFCETDGQELVIGGEEVEPEFALEEFELAALTDYISDKVPPKIYNQITDSDLNFKGVDIEKMARKLLKDESLQTVVNDARDLLIID